MRGLHNVVLEGPSRVTVIGFHLPDFTRSWVVDGRQHTTPLSCKVLPLPLPHTVHNQELTWDGGKLFPAADYGWKAYIPLPDDRKILKCILFSYDFFNSSYAFFINVVQLYCACFGSMYAKIGTIKRRKVSMAPTQRWCTNIFQLYRSRICIP